MGKRKTLRYMITGVAVSVSAVAILLGLGCSSPRIESNIIPDSTAVAVHQYST